MESSQFTDSQPRYEALEPIATSGSMCDAFRIRLHGKLHFLKRLKPQYAHDIRYREALRKEFETGYRLEHPHLARYIAMTDDGCGLLMEYVDGLTLSQRLTAQPGYFRHRKNADRLLRQLTDAVGYLHAHQVVHLDLKPDNILITRIGGDVKLVDLGCCLTDTFSDTRGHTPAYAAPEQTAGGTVDERTDIYALGRIIACLPVRAQRYRKVAARCTQPHPTLRYPSVGELQRHLFSHNKTLPLMTCATLIIGVAAYLAYSLSPSSASSPSQPAAEADASSAGSSRPPVVADASSVGGSDLAIEPSQPATAVPVAAKPETIVVVQQQPAAPPKDAHALMRKDVEQLVDQAYRATIVTFCDSLFPSPSPTTGDSWARASTAFHNQAMEIGTQMAEKYPQLSESAIRQEVEQQFQALVAYVFNRMRKNGEGQ